MALFASNIITSDSALGSAVIQRSLRFNSSDNTRLTRTPSSNGNKRTWTISVWIKRSAFTTTLNGLMVSGTNNPDTIIKLDDGRFEISRYGGGYTNRVTASAPLRDFSAWYHLVGAVDTTQSTSSNRVKLYINGTQVTDFDNSSYPSENYEYPEMNDTGNSVKIGHHNTGGTPQQLDAYLAEFNFIDGQQLDPSYFGFTDPVTNIWMPKRYEGIYGTNGFNLDFSDNSSAAALGIDKSPNGNDFTVNNISVSAGSGNDSLEDTPTNNFCTLNPLDVYGDGVSEEVTNGNLEAKNTSSSYRTTRSTFHVKTGKWYYEAKVIAAGSNFLVGMAGPDYVAGSGARRAYNINGQKYGQDGFGYSYGATYTTNDVIGVAMDLDIGTLTFYKNGTSQGVAFTDLLTYLVGSGWTPIFNGNSSSHAAFNFGQRPFSYTPPTGHKTLRSANLPLTVPSVVRPQKHFKTALWTGNGGTSQDISSLEFQPDLIWFKGRNHGGQNVWIDSVRGTNKNIKSDGNAVEGTTTAFLLSFNPNGFTVGQSGTTNGSSETNVGWCWKAGGAAVSNSDGSITSSISANQECGFSIITYTGTGSAATIGHGLGKAPKLIIVKNRTTQQDWFVNNGMILNDLGKYYKLNSSGSSNASDTNVFPNTSPTSTVFSVGGDNAVNGSGDNYVAYVWSEIPGFSQFGYWTGNGSTDGAYIHTGFTPKLIIYRKESDTNWHMLDTERDSLNPNTAGLDPNLPNAEADDSNLAIDFLGSGFKLRTSHSTANGSGTKYIYYTWAGQPGTTPFATYPNAR